MAFDVLVVVAFRKVLKSSENPPKPTLLPKPTSLVPPEQLVKDPQCLVTSAGMTELRQAFLKLDLTDDGRYFMLKKLH